MDTIFNGLSGWGKVGSPGAYSGGVSGVDWFAVRRGVSFLGEGFYGT